MDAEQTTRGAAVADDYDPRRFDWPLAYEAENQFVRERVAAFSSRNSFARLLAERMREETATDFFEWIDHLVLSPADQPTCRQVGFELEPGVETIDGDTVWQHPRATLPRVILRGGGRGKPSHRAAAGTRCGFCGGAIARGSDRRGAVFALAPGDGERGERRTPRSGGAPGVPGILCRRP